MVDLDDEAAARREVEEIGPLTPSFLKRRKASFLSSRPRAARSPEVKPPQASAEKPLNESQTLENQSLVSYREAALTTVAPITVEATTLAPIDRRNAWRTVLFILTVLAAPLAFWKGSSIAPAERSRGPVCRDLGRIFERFRLRRMLEFQGPRVQGDPWSAVQRDQARLRAILRVADDRQAARSQLHAELMPPPRPRNQFEQAGFISSLKDMIA